MKIFIRKIGHRLAEDIHKDNKEYLLWANGDEITADEIRRNFMITETQGHYNLEHQDDDFRIEDIIIKRIIIG